VDHDESTDHEENRDAHKFGMNAIDIEICVIDNDPDRSDCPQDLQICNHSMIVRYADAAFNMEGPPCWCRYLGLIRYDRNLAE
jgi:hypothetical protein